MTPVPFSPQRCALLLAVPVALAVPLAGARFVGPRPTGPARAAGLTPAPSAPIAPPSAEFLALLPDGEEKRRFIVGCTGCHLFDGRVAFPGDTARSLASWRERIATMHERFGPASGFPIIAEPRPVDSLAAWLHGALRRATPPVPREWTGDARVREYELPVPPDLPHDLIVAPDGDVIITGMFTAQMYRLDAASGRITTEAIPVPQANPRALHIDADGTWWVLLGGPGQIAERTPAGDWRMHDVGMYAHSIARDARGVWVNGHFTGHPSVLAHVAAASGALTRVELPSVTPPGVSPIPYELRTGPDGRVWMSELHGGRVLAHDPATGAHEVFAMPVSHAGPRRLDVSRSGDVWIPLYAASEVVVLTPATRAMRRLPLPDADALPYVVRVDDARGVAWVGTGASDAVYRIRMATGAIERIPLPSRGALVRHLDIDARTGDCWVAYGASPGQLPARVARIRGGD